jgi:hypothetical protein
MGSIPRLTDWLTVNRSVTSTVKIIPCGGGIEYHHGDPASRRRRRKGKSQIWDSKIWLRVQRDSDPRINTLANINSSCKRQTRPLVREDSPWLSNSNKYLGLDWSTVSMWPWRCLKQSKGWLWNRNQKDEISILYWRLRRKDFMCNLECVIQ